MQSCLQVMAQHGFTGDDVRSFGLPDPIVPFCYGDFLTATTLDSCRLAAPISSVAWAGSLAATQTAAKLVFEGVSLFDVDDSVCAAPPICIPYDNYVRAVPSKFRRAYPIVDAAGVATPAAFVRGQGFSFGKDPDANKLSNNTIVLSAAAGAIVFRAVEDSCGQLQSMAMVEFAT